ncbi:hypothetical protein LOK49_LG12G00918 [Camellia lanceoleosa]|uniref:Uncharacterized protein n=1 Tax=Camellia lanceoleosa TaxID=1840588 RepID=A0ACC0FN95_9ERIC|nr:hypothetical protein LOK49_LG12G00918 [Camellia lanceoleosa]
MPSFKIMAQTQGLRLGSGSGLNGLGPHWAAGRLQTARGSRAKITPLLFSFLHLTDTVLIDFLMGKLQIHLLRFT